MKINFFTIFLFFLSFVANSQNIQKETAVNAAFYQIIRNNKVNAVTISGCVPHYSESGTLQFYEFLLSPKGYIIVSGSSKLSPIIAYSYENNLDNEGLFLNFIKKDISKRLQFISGRTDNKNDKTHIDWENYRSENSYRKTIQQWPEAGTTTSGGWVEINWTQTAPYNNFCPIDPTNDNRSIAGCPSVAMAMIVDFHKTTNQVFFSDSDDYHHVYAGRNYWIDDDHIARDFPSWPMLNVYLDTLQEHYEHDISLTNNDKAALVYACGVAAKQVYTSSGSGTFSVSQAHDAYLKFNFSQAQLIDTSDIADSSFYNIIIQNIKDTMPVHLAIVDSLWTTGHNIVVDGYNTDGFFHFNFGWGGSANGWYLMLDNMPYSMNFIEGAVVNIKPQSGSGAKKINSEEKILVYPNPSVSIVNIEVPGNNVAENHVSIRNSIGQEIMKLPLNFINNNKFQINISILNKGFYTGVINTENNSYIFRILKL